MLLGRVCKSSRGECECENKNEHVGRRVLA